MSRRIFWEISFEDYSIIVSNDVASLKTIVEQPVILLLDGNNWDENSSFAKFALLVDGLSDEDIKALLTDEYLRLVCYRFDKRALVIAESERLIIRELQEKDISGVIQIFDEDARNDISFLEDFAGAYDDAFIILKNYIDNTYSFMNYGIWAIFIKESNPCNEISCDTTNLTDRTVKFVGLVGFSAKDSNEEKRVILANGDAESEQSLEMGYAVISEYKRQGIAFEACKMALLYAQRNIDYKQIYAVINPLNYAALNLAMKLKESIDIS